MATEDDDEYIIPLQDQRVFGAGIKRKGITFVPAAPLETTLPTTTNEPTPSVADTYLSIVLPKSSTSKPQQSEPLPTESLPAPSTALPPTDITHSSSIAHQLSLPHSHPPSHLPRTHMGVKYLSSHGWDPDSRRGLGPREDGIRIPIKASSKNDTTGLRERLDDDDVSSTISTMKKRAKNARDEQKDRSTLVVKSDAKAVRKRDAESKKRAEKLRASFYGSVDVEKYLGSDDGSQQVDISEFKAGRGRGGGRRGG